MDSQLLSSLLDLFRNAMQRVAPVGVVLVLVLLGLLVRALVPLEPGGATPPQGSAVTQHAPLAGSTGVPTPASRHWPESATRPVGVPATGFPPPVRSRMTTHPTQPVYVCSLRQQA